MREKFRITYNSPAVLTFILICFLVMLADEKTNGKSTDMLFVLKHSSLKDPLTYLRLFTHVLGHGS